MSAAVHAETPTTTSSASKVPFRLPNWIGPLAALVVLCVFLSFLSPTFLTLNNVFNIGQQVAILAVIAIGGTAVIILGGIDLSVGSVLALAGAFIGVLHVTHGINVWIATGAALLVGLLCGLGNGALVVYGKLPPFIATLAMMSIARGLSLVVLDGRPLSGYPDSFRNLATFYVGGWLPSSVIIAVLVMALAWLYYRHAAMGRAMYALGANYQVARLSGLPVRRMTLLVYGMAGLLAGAGGVMMTARLGSAQPTAAVGIELDVIAAVVIGGASLVGGYGSIVGTAIGVLIIGVLRNGLNLLNVSSFWQQVVIGCVIALAVLIENARQRRSSQ